LRKGDEFALKNARTSKRHSQCKECGRRNARDHYLANHAAYIERNRRNTPGQRLRNASIVLEHLLVHPCVQCGERDPVVLEFNHKDPGAKSANVADLVQSGCSVQRLRDEIVKCEVLCANCHQRFTSNARSAHYRRGAASISTCSTRSFRAAADARNHQLVLQVLSGARCVDCAESDPVVLQFDHVRDKADHISWLVGSGCSPLRLARELSKCEIRCANCHRRVTARARGWFRARQHNPIGI
jgi:hypothetical protein